MPTLSNSQNTFQPSERESEYFDDSRRLTGPNLFFASTGAVLEAFGPAMKDAAAHVRWRAHVSALCDALAWTTSETVVRVHHASTSLALSAPIDQLFTATEVNEWAWETATAEAHPDLNISNALDGAPNDVGDFNAAVARLKSRAASERNPALRALIDAAKARNVQCYVDDETVSVGSGAGSKVVSPRNDGALKVIDWRGVSDIPVVLVTGSNGKTTTTRLIAAFAAAHGWTPGVSSTEGVVIGGEQVTTGDYSGPAGARTVLRDTRVQCAVLESARGGMLRRGLAVSHADVAVVTNISADHFGEYGIDNLDDLSDAKLIVARGLKASGTLALNAEDPVLMRRSGHLWPKAAVFAGVFDHALLHKKQAEGGLVCGVRDGELLLANGEEVFSLGSVIDMPLTAQGAATYNIVNIAAAVIAGFALGINHETISTVLTTFGEKRHDNPGRLEQWNIRGVHVLIDYAHNPAGLNGLVAVANAKRALGSRMGLLLGQAGNREDADIVALARAAAKAKPDYIVLKDIEGFLRGRTPGEVPSMLSNALIGAGFQASSIETELNEFAAAKKIFQWARVGDVVVLPMHGTVARQAMRDWLDALETSER
jgi:cyanophycin synthetase